ncbi:Uncharacterized protein BM_BM8588 [Brugia malayi]|uniref:Bm8588 n=2 Tax=Brugia TaxID=6278 RepID=A0A0H5S1A2_BRUMA|nr:Uncharacterized protein BM_BM8588 [Brugia malayi]CRZ22508.1 Bm8588 [Brugia malayi]VDO44758.1 unnamed protein product [Brugia timori]VIO99176.1 Uncharacterized protein BM_BM8588 [Brugia malayi]
MNETTMNMQDVDDEAKNENLVRDYLLHQLQLNLLHAQWQDKPNAEPVEELMEAKRTMQEIEDDVVKKFTALNEQYELINSKLYNRIIDPEKVHELENYQEMLKEIERLSVKHQTILNKFNGDAEACLADHQVRAEEMEQLKNEIENQKELIATLNAQISSINSKLLSP